MTDPTPSPNGLISNRFRLGGLLGSGGSASVYEAVDVETGETVALKVLHPHLSRSDAARTAFFEEARAAEVLRHPNIVGVRDVGVHETDGEPLAWIALEHAPGTSLAELVERDGPLALGEALAVADGVLSALGYAHRAGLIHRDVSPANIMVARDPRGALRPSGVRLVDFGLADAAGRAAVGTDVLRTPAPADGTAEGAADPTAAPRPRGVLGNVNFLSPEQARGDPVDERGDLYQLGAVLYFALVGRPPFVRDDPRAVMLAHLQAPPPVLSVTRRGTPRAVDRLVVRALLKDPELRFADADEMLVAVRTAARHLTPPPGVADAGAGSRAGAAGDGFRPGIGNDRDPDGDGHGDGDGPGVGDGYRHGNRATDGDGHGHRDGDGHGVGNGYQHGDRATDGDGDGHGVGDGYRHGSRATDGDGHGDGGGHGDGDGLGDGYRHGNRATDGDGPGDGDGYRHGDRVTDGSRGDARTRVMPIPGDRAAAARTAASEAETTVLPRARARAWGAGGSAGGRALSGGAADASASYGGRAGAAPGTGISTGTPWSRAGIAAPSSAGLGASGPGAPGTRASGPAAPTPALAPRNRFGLWLILGLAASIVVVAWALAATAVPPPTLAAGPETEPPPPATTTAPPPPPSPTTTEVPLVVVPELASGTLAAARDALAAAGLTLGTVSAENSALAAETVLAADPVSGSSLAAGGTVNLVVASGSNSVPRIAGSTQADALAGLRSAGFEALVTTRADDAPPGTVLGSAPAEGAVARIGTTISVVIATPRPPVSTPTITPPPTSTSTPTPNPTDTAEPRPPSEG